MLVLIHVLSYLIFGFLLLHWIDSSLEYQFGEDFHVMMFWNSPWMTLWTMVIIWPLCFVWWLLFYRRK